MFGKLLKEMLRSEPVSGLRKPEPLKHNLSDLWSKWISNVNLMSTKFTTANRIASVFLEIEIALISDLTQVR